jgi:hypothetical protein
LRPRPRRLHPAVATSLRSRREVSAGPTESLSQPTQQPVARRRGRGLSRVLGTFSALLSRWVVAGAHQRNKGRFQPELERRDPSQAKTTTRWSRLIRPRCDAGHPYDAGLLRQRDFSCALRASTWPGGRAVLSSHLLTPTRGSTDPLADQARGSDGRRPGTLRTQANNATALGRASTHCPCGTTGTTGTVLGHSQDVDVVPGLDSA